MDLYSRIWEYETSKLPLETIVLLFQELVDSGMIWSLPAQYLDVASRMYHNGHIKIGKPKG